MIRIVSIVILLICTSFLHLLATDSCTVQSARCNEIRMKRGRYVDKVWIGSKFNKRDGFKVSDVRYDVKITNKAVIDYLPAAFYSIKSGKDSYNLVIAVIEFSEKVTSISPYNNNHICIEGRVFNNYEELIAVFQVERTFPSSAIDIKFAIDDVIRKIKKELC